jgi:RNA polymerase sigma factor (sigma-70 family)
VVVAARMGDEAGAESQAARLRALDWGRLAERLVDFALKEGAGHEAEDLANHAIARLIQDRGASWDPESDPTGLYYLMGVLKDRLKGQRRTEKRRQEKRPTVVDSDVVDETAPESDRTAERTMIETESIRRKLARLRERLTDYPLTLAMVDLCVAEGRLSPAEIAARLGVDVKRVYRAEEQLLRNVRRLREEGSDPHIPAVKAATRGAS